MKKFNWKGLIAILTIVISLVILVHDLYLLTIGYCYTSYGLFTVAFILFVFNEAIEYIKSRIK